MSSTVSKVLRQKEKYLFCEDGSKSPIKRSKGKVPDIDRALASWVRNSQKQGVPLTDANIKEKARFFATTVGNTESHVKANSTTWLEKFKQKNGISANKLVRRASETNISDSGPLGWESRTASQSTTPSGISPSSPIGAPSPSLVSMGQMEDNVKTESPDSYLDFVSGGYRESNSQSTTSLSSAYTDRGLSSFSGGTESPTAHFTFSPDTTCNQASFLPSQHSCLPPTGSSNFQRPRSQTFPSLGIDPALFAEPHDQEPITPKYHQSVTAPSSALESPDHELAQPFDMDSTLSASPVLHHSSSCGSMAPPSVTTVPTSGNGTASAPSSQCNSPTQDDARRALDTLLSYLSIAPSGLVDEGEYMAVLKLTEKLRVSGPHISVGLHRIPEQESDVVLPKMERIMGEAL